MFNLTEAELDNARDAIDHHGFSTMLPTPPEWEVVKNNWTTVRAALEKLDLDTYEPFKLTKVFAPKNRANIRVVHLLHPQDLIIYTALVLIAKNDIEQSRIPVRAKKVFSYRVDTSSDTTLYEVKNSHEKYRNQLEVKAETPATKYVAMADIADFFPRVYQHRLENVIESIATSQRVRDVARVLVKKLVSNLMGRNSYGIPVGPYASRILAEAILIDVDSTLQSKNVSFVRWVDDYHIFCSSEYEAQSVLFHLGEWLYTNHGLTLQTAKTKILPIARFKQEVLLKHDAALTDRDYAVNILRDFRFGYDDAADEEEPTEEEIQTILEFFHGIDLQAMLENSLSDTTLVDYEAVVYVLTKIPRIPGLDEDLKRTVLELVIDNAELLYPVAEQISKYVLSFDNLSSKDRKTIAKKLLKPLKSKRNPPPPYYAMWVLHIFASSPRWNHSEEIFQLYSETTSEIIKRLAALVVYTSGTRAHALAIKDDYTNASPLLKMAILYASKKLGPDERKHWKLSNGISGAIEKLI
ncbi:RNA-directed DNA polymerase [Pseudomonas hunanensis]|uniref:RNA-directed DNA polymerase n=1 Tax=Pseudomonas hunanensis TaxID=1247546 RepID=UPI0038162575